MNVNQAAFRELADAEIELEVAVCLQEPITTVVKKPLKTPYS